MSRLSAQLFYITKVKKDPDDNTISMSILCLSGPNADFDGDALNVWFILDRMQYDALYPLSPHFGLLSMAQPRSISNDVALPKPLLATMANWIEHGRNRVKG